MKPFMVDRLQDGVTTYFLIRNTEDLAIEPLSTGYLAYKVKTHKSPNSIKRQAYSINYYLNYLVSNNIILKDVFGLSFKDQHIHFSDFLYWIKSGSHLSKKITKNGKAIKMPGNKTCNTYLRDVLSWLQYLSLNKNQSDLKIFSTITTSYSNSAGVRLTKQIHSFRGYLPEVDNVGTSAKENELLILYNSCANTRDRLLLMLLIDSGYRIGEVLGIKYASDIDYDNHTVRVCFREHNSNQSRAKYAEEREIEFGEDTFTTLMLYLAENRESLLKSDYLFQKVDGSNEPLTINAVYAIFRRLEKKTGIKITPHKIRHYFADERYRAGWNISLIAEALGHKDIKTTMRYLHITNELMDDAQEEYLKNNKGKFSMDYLY